MRYFPCWLLLTFLGAGQTAAAVPAEVSEIEAAYQRSVDKRLDVPASEQRDYAGHLRDALVSAGLHDPQPQYYLLVDRSPMVQAVFVYWLGTGDTWRLIGASPASTGFAGGFEYFLTPLGVFEHTLANLDFRAEGTRNKFGIRGYGVRGMRVFDFGWVDGERTWGTGGRSPMRLQVHATDPDFLENQLGRARSKGCIRIPASLNTLLDQRGLLDAEYERALREGRHFWVLRTERQPVASAGKYLVVVESSRARRPAWSPEPARGR